MAIKKVKKSEYEKAKKEREARYKQERKENVLNAVAEGAVTSANNGKKLEYITNARFELPEANGKKFGTVSYSAAKALEEGRLREYQPKDDEEKNTINKFLNYEGIPLTTNDGVNHGYIRYSLYEDMVNGKALEELKPTSAKEAVTLKRYANYASVPLKHEDGTEFGKISYNTAKAWSEGKTPDQTNMSDAEKKAISNYTEYANKKAKEERIKSDPVFARYGIDPAEFDMDAMRKWAKEHNHFEKQAPPGTNQHGFNPNRDGNGKYIATEQEIKDGQYLFDYVLNEQQKEADKIKKQIDEEYKKMGAEIIAHPFRTVGYYLGKATVGATGSVEDIIKTVRVAPKWITGKALDLVGADKAAEEMENQVGEILDKKTLSEKASEKLDNMVDSGLLKFTGSAFESAGNMAAPIVAEFATTGISPWLEAKFATTGMKITHKVVEPTTKAGKIINNMTKPSSLVFMASTFGSSASNAYRKTGDADKAVAYGTLNALAENLTEQIFGGFAGTDIGEALIDFKIKNRTARKFVNVATEGVEEMIMTFAEPGISRITGVDKNVPLPTAKEVFESGMSGILVSGIMNVSTMPITRSNRKKTVETLNKVSESLNTQVDNEELRFELLKINASEQEIEERQQDLEDFGNEYAYAVISTLDNYGDIVEEKESIIKTGLEYDKKSRACENAKELSKKKEVSKKDLVRQLVLNMGEKSRIESEKINNATKYAPETASETVKTLENELILDDVAEKHRQAIVTSAAELETSLDALTKTDKTVASVLRANNNLVERSEGLLNSESAKENTTDYYSLYGANLEVLASRDSIISDNFVRAYAENYAKGLENGNSLAYRVLAEKANNVSEVLSDYVLTGNVPDSLAGTNIVETAGNNLKSIISSAVSSVASAHSYIYRNETNLSQQAKAIKSGDFSSVTSKEASPKAFTESADVSLSEQEIQIGDTFYFPEENKTYKVIDKVGNSTTFEVTSESGTIIKKMSNNFVEKYFTEDKRRTENPENVAETEETMPVGQLLEDYNGAVDSILSVSDEAAKEMAEKRVAVEVLKNTPDVILDNVEGAKDLKVIINYNKLYLAVRKNGVFEGHYHNLGVDIAKKLPEFLNAPDAIIQLANGRLNLFATVATEKGDNGIISVELNSTKDIGGKYDDYNVVVTMFSSDDNYAQNLISGEGVTEKYKREDLSQVNPQLYTWLAIINDKSSTDNIISHDNNAVNDSVSKSDKNVSDKTLNEVEPEQDYEAEEYEPEDDGVDVSILDEEVEDAEFTEEDVLIEKESSRKAEDVKKSFGEAGKKAYEKVLRIEQDLHSALSEYELLREFEKSYKDGFQDRKSERQSKLSEQSVKEAEKAGKKDGKGKKPKYSVATGESKNNPDTRYSVDNNFASEYDKWVEEGRPYRKSLTVGKTSDTLKSIGVKEQKITWDTSKINETLTKHKYLNDTVLKQIPNLIENPVIVMQSKSINSRITMFGEVYDGDGLPVMAVLELQPKNRRQTIVLNEIKVVSTHSRKNSNPADIAQTQNMIDTSDILYIEPDKKRTNNWLTLNRLQLPLSVTNYGSIKNITYPKEIVNRNFEKNHADISVQGKGTVKWNTLHPRQQKAIVFMEGFAKAANLKLVFVANSPKFNGAYDISGDTMYIDIFAGVDPMDKLSDIIIPTASHELTHWMHYQAPVAWSKLSGAVFKALEEVDGISREQRIKNKMARLKKKGLVYNELVAEDEIVARACEDMLAKSEVGKKIFNSLSESEQKTITGKIKSIIQKLQDWISNFLSSYKPSNRTEAVKIRKAQDKANEILKLWDEGIEKSVKVSKAETKAEAFVGNDVYEQYGVQFEGEDGKLYSLKDDASSEIDKVLSDKHYGKEVQLTNNSPAILTSQKGVRDLPMMMVASHIRENILTETEAKKLGLSTGSDKYFHGLGKKLFLKVIDGLDNVTEAYRGTKNAENNNRRENYFLLISQYKDSDGNTINVPVYVNEHGMYNRIFVDTNKIATVFGREEFDSYIKKQLADGNLVRIKNRSLQASESTPLIGGDYSKNASTDRISQPDKDVKGNLLLSEKDDNSITVDDIKSIQSIGRKSVNQFTSEDIVKTEKFARKYFEEMGVKSPFFRAWFGDWRVNDQTPIHMVTEKGSERGIIKNKDTNWSIQVSGKVFNETKAHNQNYNVTARPYLEYINSIVENAILLDSYTIEEGKSKSENSAMMHSLYAVADIGNEKEVLKLYVEELNDVNSDGTIKRSYQLQNITNQQTNDRVQEDSLAPSASSADIKNISDLFRFVKTYDKNFNPNPVSSVVNEDGTPKVMYRGDDNMDFTVFDRKKSRASNLYGRGFYFTESESAARTYGKTHSFYLNVDTPLTPGEHKITKGQLKRLLEAVAGNEDDYDIWNYGTTDINEIADSLYGKGDFEMLYDISATAVGDMVETAELFNSVNGTKYDGIVAKTETVVFDSTQIKSATDNIGTFDKNNPDIRYSEKDTVPAKKTVKKTVKKTSEQIYREQNKALMQYIKDEYDKPWRFQPKMEDVAKAANRLGKGYVGDKDLKQEIGRIYRNVKKAVDMSKRHGVSEAEINRWWDIVQEDVDNLAMDIVMNHQEKNDANWQLIKGLRDYMRGRTIRVPAENKGDFEAQGGLETFRKHNMSRFFISQTKGESIETLYPELRGMFGNLLPDISNPSDQLIALSDLYDEMAVTFDNPYDADIEAAQQSMSLEIMADMLVNIREVAWDPESQRLEAIYKIIQTEREKRYNALKRAKDRQDRKIREAKAKAKERAEKRVDATARQRLLAVAKELDRISKKSEPEIQATIQKLIGHLDLASVSITGQKLAELGMIKEFYDQMKLNPDFVPDERIDNMLARLDKKQISDLELEDVITLTNILLGIEHKLRTDAYAIESENKKKLYIQAEEIMRNIENSAGSKGKGFGKLVDNYVTGMLTPVREVHRITGYVDNDPLYLTTKEVQKGQVNMLNYQMKSEKMFEKYTKDTEFMESLTGAKAKTYTYNIVEKNSKGKVLRNRTITITAGMRISLLLHNLNSSNQKHMSEGGVTIPNIEILKTGNIEEAYARGEKIYLQKSDIEKITSDLTEKEREYARQVWRYYNNFAKNEINKVSLKLKGYMLAMVKNYFPINTNKKFSKQDFEAIRKDGTIEGMGNLKERTDSSVPIYLRDVVSVLDESIRMNSRYVGLAIPVRNMSLLLEKSFSKYEEATEEQKIVSGQEYTLTEGYYGSVMNSIAEKWGVNGEEYIKKMMRDIQGVKQDKDEGFLAKGIKWLGNRYSRAVLALNPKVAGNQIASLATAIPEVDPKALARAVIDFGKVDLDEIAERTSLQYMRSKGASEPTIADSTRVKKGPLAVVDKAIDKVDMMTWTDTKVTRKLYKVAEYTIQYTRKDLEVGSEEYKDAVNEVYENIMLNTQPNVSMMERPQFLRSDDITRMLMPFTGEPLKNVNMIFDSVENYKAKARQLGQIKNNKMATAEEIKAAEGRLKQAGSNLRVTVLSQLLASFLYSAENAFFNILFGNIEKYWDDEEEKLTFLSVISALARDTAINFVTQLPFASLIVDTAGYFVDRATGKKAYTPSINPLAFDSLETIFETVPAFVSACDDWNNGKMNWQQFAFKANDFVKKATTVTGIPYKNVEKIIVAGIKGVVKSINSNEYVEDYTILKFDEALVEESKNDEGEIQIKGSKETYDILYKAMKNGDKEAYNAIVKDLADRGVKYSEIESAMQSRAEKDENFDIDKSLGFYSGVEEKPKNETFEKYIDDAEELGIKEDDLKAVVDFAESKKGYKERKKDAEEYIEEHNIDEAGKKFLMGVVADSYSVNDLNNEQYQKYAETRAIYREKIQREVDWEGKDERDIKEIYNKISTLTEKYALSEASDGEYSMRAKWMNAAIDAENTLGISTGKFIEGYTEYGSAIYSEKAMITHEVGYDVFDYLEFRNLTKDLKSEKDKNGKDIKGKTKQDKLIKVLKEMDVPSEVKAYLYSTEYSSKKNNPWKNYLKKDYNKYAEDEK